MTNTPSARLAGALSRITAAGLTARQVEIETPDGAPMKLTLIDAGRLTAPGRWRGSRARSSRADWRRGGPCRKPDETGISRASLNANI
jgi:hypothetical protein